jgi:hypothetical protein
MRNAYRILVGKSLEIPRWRLLDNIKMGVTERDCEDVRWMEPSGIIIVIGFEVLTAVSTKMAVFWVVAPGALMMEATRTSETLVNFYQTTRLYNPEDSHLHYYTTLIFITANCFTSI